MAPRKAPQSRGLRFVGDDSRFIPGVPTRDLSPEESEHFAPLVAGSDLYTEAASASAATEKADTPKGVIDD